MENTLVEELLHTMYECSVSNTLATVVGGVTGVQTPSGFVDVLSDTEVIAVKHYKQWMKGFGEVFVYGSHYPQLAKRLHLFAYTPDASAEELVDHAKSMCGLHAVEVTFELIPVPRDSEAGAAVDISPLLKKRRH